MAQLKATDNYIWSLADVLGQGATGAVYMARHKVKNANLSKLSYYYKFVKANSCISETV